MKYLFLLLLLPATGFAQRFVIVDPNLKAPLIFSDTVSIKQLEAGFITMDSNKVDSILIFLQEVVQRLSKVTFNKFYSLKWKAGLTTITITMERQAYGDKYNVILHTETGNNPEYSVPIITTWEANGDTRRNLQRFIDFVKTNLKQ